MAALAKCISDLNQSGAFRPLKKAEEMVLNKFYRCKGLEIKTTTYGKRFMVHLAADEGDKEDTALFLPSSFFTDGEKKKNILKIFTDPEKLKILIACTDRLPNEKGKGCIPRYCFKLEEIEEEEEATSED